MIYWVSEWFGNDEQTFFFDTSKVDQGVPFEATYAALCAAASCLPDKTLFVNRDESLINSVSDRFGKYQDGERCWTRLHALLPCQVDERVTLVFDE
jgi:hypothetical protein